MHSSHSFPRSCCPPGSAPETPGPRQQLQTSWTQIRAVFWGQTMHGGEGQVLSHTSLGFLVEICLSSSLLQWDMEKCGRYRKSQGTHGTLGRSQCGSACNQKLPDPQWSQIPKYGQFWAKQFPL